MLPDVDKDNSRPVIYGGDLYCFEVYSEDENGGLCILKAELDNVDTRTVEEGKWVDFVEEMWPSVFPSGHPSVISDVTPSGGWSLLCAKFLQAITMG
jgi:hypothetical protein